MTHSNGVLTCGDVQARLDDYRDRRLDPTDEASVKEHLASCEGCRTALANRVALLGRLKNAVKNTEVPPDLGHRVQFAIAQAGTPRRVVTGNFGKPLMAIAAALLIAAGAFYFLARWQFRAIKETQEQFIARLSYQVAPLMRVGLKQHLHCGVFREYPAIAPALADLARDKQVSAALIDAVETHAPEGLHVVMAHRCNYQGRDYIHVVARGEGHLMSLLVTPRAAGESLSTAHSGTGAYAVDAFETPDYLIFLVSDKTPEENRQALKAMAAQVQAALL